MQKIKSLANHPWATNIVALFIILIGIVVLLVGWIGGVGWLTSIFPSCVTMKGLTAFNFILVGTLLLFYISKLHDIIVPFCSMILVLSSLVAFAQVGDIEHFAFEDTATYTVESNQPSVLTLVSFILIGVTGFASYINGGRFAIVLGAVVMAIGLVALAGYIFSIPLLFYYIPEFSSAMAVHTAILFSLSGWAFIKEGRRLKLFNMLCAKQENSEQKTPLAPIVILAVIISSLSTYGVTTTTNQNDNTSERIDELNLLLLLQKKEYINRLENFHVSLERRFSDLEAMNDDTKELLVWRVPKQP